MTPEIEIRAAVPGDERAVVELLAASVGWVPDEHHTAFFQWKHQANPFGQSPAWVADVAGRVVGFRTFLRWEFEAPDGLRSAVRAVDTATDPEFRGGGVFTRLTRHALEVVRDEGVDFVFNTPNDQSRPGYLKMGWEEVGRLPVQVRPSSLGALARMLRSRTAAELWSLPAGGGVPAIDALADRAAIGQLLATQPAPSGMRTALTTDHLQWRFGFAPLNYRAVLAGSSAADGLAVFRARRRGAATECVVAALLVPHAEPTLSARLAREALRASGATYAIGLRSALGRLRGFVPVAGVGPVLTWRAVNQERKPALADWDLTLGDVELF